MKKFLSALLMVLLVSSVSVAADPIKLNSDQSKIEFLGKKTDGEHAGGFKKFTVEALADFEDPSKSSLKIVIDTTSLWSDDPKLTDHLKNPDFFDVRKYPEIKFESTSIQPDGESKANIIGKLTMLGKTEEVKVPCDVEASDDKIELTAKFEIDRTKWGMTYGVGKVNKEVAITAKMSFKR
jgi:polyisoprenoid-binding protein YceI